MIEEWKQIEGNETYLVSNLGKVKSPSGKILNGADEGRGYIRVCINYKLRRLHQLVAKAFIENPENKKEINHIDGNKKNNCINNLEWVTRKENMAHAFKTKLCVNKSGEYASRSILTSEQVEYVRKNYIPRHHEFGQSAMARKLGVHNSTLSCICRRITY